MKTKTIKRFEKDLKDNGFEFEVIKEKTNKTYYDIWNNVHREENYEAWNVLDTKANNFKMFKLLYDTAIKLEQIEKNRGNK